MLVGFVLVVMFYLVCFGVFCFWFVFDFLYDVFWLFFVCSCFRWNLMILFVVWRLFIWGCINVFCFVICRMFWGKIIKVVIICGCLRFLVCWWWDFYVLVVVFVWCCCYGYWFWFWFWGYIDSFLLMCWRIWYLSFVYVVCLFVGFCNFFCFDFGLGFFWILVFKFVFFVVLGLKC